MSEIPLLLGVGLGGIGIGTIIAAGYLYSNKDKEQLKDDARGVAQTLNPRSSYEKIANIRTDEIIKSNAVKEEQAKEQSGEIAKLENLYKDVYILNEELLPINKQLDESSTLIGDKLKLGKRRAEILDQARILEKKIKKYDSNLRQIAKNNISLEQDIVARSTSIQNKERQSTSVDVDADETPKDLDTSYEDIYEREEDDSLFERKSVEDDLNMPFERNDSFSSVGGSKYLSLTYTPKKYKSNNKINKRKSKRNKINKINKRKSKRNKHLHLSTLSQ